MSVIVDKYLSLTPAERKEFHRLHPRKAGKVEFEAVRMAARADFWYFLDKILRIPVLYGPLHRPLARWMGSWSKPAKLCLLPRGHLKSSICNAAFTAWEVCRNPEIRILIVSHKADDAIKFVGWARSYLDSPGVRKYFPEITPKMNKSGRPQKWSGKGLLLHRKGHYKEDTVEYSSHDAQVTGRHYDLVIFDDLVTKDSVASPELMAKTQEYHQHCQALLEPGAREMMIGTRYDFSDLYGTIIETPELAGEYDIVVKSCYDAAGKPILPTRFTELEDDLPCPENPANARKSLPAVKRKMGTWVYACQYENNPVPTDLQVFKPDWIQVIDRLPDQHLRYFRVCDLSSEKETKTSWTAIVTGAVDSDSNVYITDIFWGNFSGDKIISELIRGQQVASEKRPIRVGMEPGPYERSLKPFMRQAMAKEKTYIPWSWLKGEQSEVNKEERIRGLQPWFENGMIYFMRNCRNREKAEEELIRFPRFKRKDIIDALAQIEHIMFPGKKPETKSATPKYEDWLDPALIQGDQTWIGQDRVMDESTAIRVSAIAYN